MPYSAANLAEWLNDPYIQDVVVGMLVDAEYPLVLRDFVTTGGLPIASANRVLMRLHGRGLVTRQRLWMHRPIYCRKRRACIADGARRLVYAYAWAEAVGEARGQYDGGDDD